MTNAATERRLSDAQTGKMAMLLMEHLTPLLDRMEAASLQRMKDRFRQGDTDQVQMLVNVAELCQLDDLRSSLKAQIHRGLNAQQEIRDAARSSD